MRNHEKSWNELAELADGYKWWASRDVTDGQEPRVHLSSKVEFVGSVLHALLFREK